MQYVLIALTLFLVGVYLQDPEFQASSGPYRLKKCKGPNEVLSNCYSPYAKTCKTRYRSDGTFCTSVCGIGCASPPKCNNCEIYNSCGSSCEVTCDNLGNNCTSCTFECKPGCFCKEGTIRAPDGTCVKPNDCPPKVCGPDEVFNPCPERCLSGYCKDLWSKFNCAKVVDCCEPKCVCRKGMLRHDNGTCITTKQCMGQI